MEEIYKVKLEASSYLKDKAFSQTKNEYIDLIDNCILTKKTDINYLLNNFKVLSIEYIGNLFNQKEITEDK